MENNKKIKIENIIKLEVAYGLGLFVAFESAAIGIQCYNDYLEYECKEYIDDEVNLNTITDFEEKISAKTKKSKIYDKGQHKVVLSVDGNNIDKFIENVPTGYEIENINRYTKDGETICNVEYINNEKVIVSHYTFGDIIEKHKVKVK